MRHPRFLLLLAAAALAACATSEPGWRGAGAEPFDGARAACNEEAAALPAGDRDAAFEDCMARRGWTR